MIRTHLQVGWLGLIVSAAAFGGALAGIARLPLEVVVLPLGFVVLLASVYYLGLGVALLPVVGVVVPFSIGTGTQSPIVAAMVFAVLLLIVWIVRGVCMGDFSLPRSRIVYPTLGLMLVWALALVVSDSVRDPLVWTPPSWTLIQLGGLSVVVVPAGIMLLAMSVGRDVRWIHWGTWAFLIVGAFATGVFFSGTEQAASAFLQTGGLFSMWYIALAYGQALFNDRLRMPVRIGLAALACAWLGKALIVQIYWFSGWLPGLIAIAVITWLRSRAGFALVALAGAVAVASNFDAVFDVVWGTTVRKGDLSRLDIWSQTLDLASRYPVLGTGPAGYAAYFQSIYAGSPFSLSTHNAYMDVLAETGIVGCVVFAWFLVSLLAVAWQARVRWRAGFLGAYAQGAFGGLVGLIVAMSQGDWLIPFVYNQTIAGFRYTVHSWVFLGFLAALTLLPARLADSEPT